MLPVACRLPPEVKIVAAEHLKGLQSLHHSLTNWAPKQDLAQGHQNPRDGPDPSTYLGTEYKYFYVLAPLPSSGVELCRSETHSAEDMSFCSLASLLTPSVVLLAVDARRTEEMWPQPLA